MVILGRKQFWLYSVRQCYERLVVIIKINMVFVRLGYVRFGQVRLIQVRFVQVKTVGDPENLTLTEETLLGQAWLGNIGEVWFGYIWLVKLGMMGLVGHGLFGWAIFNSWFLWLNQKLNDMPITKS